MPEVLRTTEELEAFQPAWKKIWREDPNATPFQHPAWLLPWWHQFGRDLRVVIVRRNGNPVAFLPFYIYEKPASNQRQLLMLGVGTSDYLDGLFTPECTPENVLAAIDLLRGESGWDAMMVSQLRPQSMLLRSLKSIANVQTSPTERCWRMPATPIAGLPSAIRRNALYYRNRAARAGTLELRMADASTWPEVFNTLVRLHTTQWQRREKSGALADAHVLAWHREAIPQLKAEGLLRLCSLHLDGEIVAAAYFLADPAGRTNRAQYLYLPAYALDHADLRPGTLLLALAMERAFEEGVESIDLLRGNEAYKQLWHTEAQATHGFTLRRARGETQRIAA